MLIVCGDPRDVVGDEWMRVLLAAVLLCSLLVSLVPAAAQAGSGAVTAHSKGGNTAPAIDAITLLEGGSDSEVSSMTPLVPYRVKVTASDVNGIDDILEIEFHVYHGSDGTSWDADQLAVFKWVKATGWLMLNGAAATTWELVEVDCVAPTDFSGTTGDWYLRFRPGKLAQAAAVQGWFCSATVRDENKSDSETWATGASMSAYSAVGFDVAGVTFGDPILGIEPGTTAHISDPSSGYLTVQVTSNATYSMGVRSDAAWTDGGSNSATLTQQKGVPAGPGRLSLEIDDRHTDQGPIGKPQNPEAIAGTNTTIAGFESVSRVTTDPGASEGTNDDTMCMSLSLSLMGIHEVVYSGSMTFTVTN